jgi:oxygen-independent coproporphyrinogen-3 oxidase
VDTVYFGGGTPTLLPTESIRELFEAIHAAFAFLPDAEITVEGNPATVDREALAVWRENGVNRLSLGAQSAQAEELKALGRLHRWEDVVNTVRAARDVGIGNINLDFMLGIPHQTPESLADTLSRALELEPTHLSAYTLMLEEGTPFYRRGRASLGLPADEDTADEQAVSLWEQASATLRAAGYEHYEISNYARPGFRSRHNLHTWQCRDYLGLGVAAHSCMDGVRFGQSRDLEGFLRGEDVTEFRQVLTPADRESEYIMLALRLSDGISEEEFASRFGRDFWHTYGRSCIPYIDGGFLCREGGRIFLTERGFPVSNTVLADIL